MYVLARSASYSAKIVVVMAKKQLLPDLWNRLSSPFPTLRTELLDVSLVSLSALSVIKRTYNAHV